MNAQIGFTLTVAIPLILSLGFVFLVEEKYFIPYKDDFNARM